MKTLMLHAAKAIGIAAVVGGVLAACGGGGDDAAGSLTAFSVVPDEATFNTTAAAASAAGVPPGTCFGGGTQDVYVYGGAAPYRIDNTSPANLTVDKTQVGDRGGHFTVTVNPNGGCFTNATVVIVDKNDNQVTFTVDNTSEDSGS